MTLYRYDSRDEQPSIGKQEHWEVFRRYQGTAYHAAVRTAITPYLEQPTIDAAITGRTILQTAGGVLVVVAPGFLCNIHKIRCESLAPLVIGMGLPVSYTHCRL